MIRLFRSKKTGERAAAITGSLSGVSGLFSSWQVCHSICLWVISLLALVGVTLTGMPLLFLTKISRPLWIMAVILLGVTVYMYVKKKCISFALILFNAGLIIAGTPFSFAQENQIIAWTIGGTISLAALSFYVIERIQSRRKK